MKLTKEQREDVINSFPSMIMETLKDLNLIDRTETKGKWEVRRTGSHFKLIQYVPHDTSGITLAEEFEINQILIYLGKIDRRKAPQKELKRMRDNAITEIIAYSSHRSIVDKWKYLL